MEGRVIQFRELHFTSAQIVATLQNSEIKLRQSAIVRVIKDEQRRIEGLPQRQRKLPQ